jgi:isopenicillin N synthase-like dioxygenase
MFKEALHRVVWDPKTQSRSDRYSIVYFCWPNWEVEVCPLDIVSKGNPSQQQQQQQQQQQRSEEKPLLFGDIVPFL